MNLDARTWEESPAFFRAAGEDVFCVLTRPVGASDGIGVVLAPGSGHMPATNRNRMSVRLARRLAQSGYHVVRIEYHGVGESSGTLRGYSLRKPFVEHVDGAVRLLRERGISNVVLVGNCFGSRTVLAYAERFPALHAVALITPPIYNSSLQKMSVELEAATAAQKAAPSVGAGGNGTGRTPSPKQRVAATVKSLARWGVGRARLLSRGEREERDHGEAAPAFRDGLQTLVGRRIPVLIVLGDQDDHYARFRKACEGKLGAIVRTAGSLLEVRILPGKVHGFSGLETQGTIIDIVDGWLGRSKGEKVAATGTSVGSAG
jgi:pimeloyl-ACP methyl ester carboxylesterase